MEQGEGYRHGLGGSALETEMERDRGFLNPAPVCLGGGTHQLVKAKGGADRRGSVSHLLVTLGVEGVEQGLREFASQDLV